jgi:superfamily II DNA or RNA helicase
MNFYQHQQEAFDEAIKQILMSPDTAKGRIVIPTGGGKTLLESKLLEYNYTNNFKTGIHLVLVPRIMLGNQLLDEFRNFLGKNAFRALAFHSGEHKVEGVKWKEVSTTDPKIVAQEYNNAQKLNQQLVIFSTYHSCGKLSGFNFDTRIADESQYCTAENFNSSYRSLTARVSIAFTATERFTASNKGFGLNNEDVFGSRWFYVSPATLIERGIIVPPRLHVMHCSAVDEDNTIVSQMIEIAKQQIELTEEDLNFSKILFATAGTKDVKVVEDNMSVFRAQFPDRDIFTITSGNGALINGVSIKRKEFLKKLKTCKNALIFHYDILAEGIDVDGITGVAVMRNMGLAKLLQTIGRAVRLFKEDPSKKKQAWISVPVINGNEDDKERLAGIVRAIRNGGYDISVEDVIETRKAKHSGKDEELEDMFGNNKVERNTGVVSEVFHEIEQDTFWIRVNEAEDINDQFDMFFEGEKNATSI